MGVIIGYISSLFGGAFGIFIGRHLMSHKRVLPNGDKVFDYSEKDRKHGKRIQYIGIIVFIALFILRFFEII